MLFGLTNTPQLSNHISTELYVATLMTFAQSTSMIFSSFQSQLENTNSTWNSLSNVYIEPSCRIVRQPQEMRILQNRTRIPRIHYRQTTETRTLNGPSTHQNHFRMRRPKTYRDIQVFLGFCNFYRQFIFNFSAIARPLHSLLNGLKNGRKSGFIAEKKWQVPQQNAFQQLIDAFISAPVLRHYDPALLLRLEADASSTACAGILSLKWEDGWNPIAYCSKKFSGSEIHYPIYDKELLAIVWSFKQ